MVAHNINKSNLERIFTDILIILFILGLIAGYVYNWYWSIDTILNLNKKEKNNDLTEYEKDKRTKAIVLLCILVLSVVISIIALLSKIYDHLRD